MIAELGVTIALKLPGGIVMYGRPWCCKGETDLKRR